MQLFRMKWCKELQQSIALCRKKERAKKSGLRCWVAVVFAPKLHFDNAILFGFIAAFLIFSNAWTYGYPVSLKLIDICWPNVAFKKPSGLHWLIQGFVLAAAVSVITILLSQLIRYLIGIFTPLISP